jgi:nitrate/nitrite transporter NarK
VVVCSYVGFRGIDNYSLYAVQAYGMNEVQGARVSAIGAWLRPVAALGAGLLGDRVRASRAATLCFALAAGAYGFLILRQPNPSTTWVLYLNVVVSCAAAFGLRGVYFAMLEEGSIKSSVTGAAVGLVSVLGYTPDVFVAPVGGWLLDRSPGVPGHQHFLVFLLAFALLGIVATLAFSSIADRARARAGAQP